MSRGDGCLDDIGWKISIFFLSVGGCLYRLIIIVNVCWKEKKSNKNKILEVTFTNWKVINQTGDG
jgi:hypothetical protein